MKSTTWLGVGTVAVLVCVQPVSGQSPWFSDDFSSYTTDLSLTASWYRNRGTAASITLATADPVTAGTRGKNITLGAGQLGQISRAFTAYTPTDQNPLVFKFDLYDSNNQATRSGGFGELRYSANGVSGANTLVTTTLFDAGLYTTVNTGTFAVNQYQARDIDNGGWIQLATSRSQGWHTFEFDIRATTVDLKIDGVVDANFSNLNWGGGTFNLIELGDTAAAGNNAINFDNFIVTVPEPSSATLAILGGLGISAFLARRRRL